MVRRPAIIGAVAACAIPAWVLISTIAPAAGTVAFSDQTGAVGLVYSPAPLVDMAGRLMVTGGAVGDFNRDGWPDLFLLGGGGPPDALFLNDGDGTFTDHAAGWDVDLRHRGRGVTVGDFNNDGWPDLYITSSGDLTLTERTGQHILYRNNGNGSFTNIAVAAGVNETSATDTVATGSAFGDYDLDGDLDLFVAAWEALDGNRLFRNDGNETFTDVTSTAGIVDDFDGFSPRFVDMNGDRYPELLVAADFVTSRYYLNDGDGTFTDITASSGTGLEDNGMGTTVADFNRDGLPDWYVSSIYRDQSIQDGNYLYVNQGNDLYTVLPESSGARNGGWGWGTEAVDFDHDGFVDIIETNGYVGAEFTDEYSYLFRNNGDMTFDNITLSSGVAYTGQGRSLVTLDADRDGDMDFVITCFDGPVVYHRNDLSGTDIHWFEVLLDTAGSGGLAPDGYGAKVTLEASRGTQYAWVNGGATYLGRSQPVAHFGLGADTLVETLTVDWPDGSSTVLTNLPADQILTVQSPGGGVGPGEPSVPTDPADQMRVGYDQLSGLIDLSYSPACNATGHTIHYGYLDDVASAAYVGAACDVGTNGAMSFDPGLVGDYFFVIVGNDGMVEGSYGRDGFGVERPEDTLASGCDLPQDLAESCDPP